MQTILGAGGAIGRELVKFLPEYTDKIRLVSRNKKNEGNNIEFFKADISDKDQTERAVENSEVVYLLVGIPYRVKIWQELWPKIMLNTIEACKKHNAKLVFFDNVYMYGKVNGWMTEQTPVNPVSKKGEIRAQIADHLMGEISKGNIRGLIARSADFYGPQVSTSILYELVFQKLKNGKTAQWMLNDSVKHSFTFTPDAAAAAAVLGNTDSAYGRVWHLPTDKNALTGKEFIELTAKEFGVKPNYFILKKWMLQSYGIFNPIVKELIEMLYQMDYDYLFDSSDFENNFFKPTNYAEGIKSVVNSGRSV